jgi:hypothetical protein
MYGSTDGAIEFQDVSDLTVNTMGCKRRMNIIPRHTPFPRSSVRDTVLSINPNGPIPINKFPVRILSKTAKIFRWKDISLVERVFRMTRKGQNQKSVAAPKKKKAYDNVKGQIGRCGIYCGSCVVGNGTLRELAKRFEETYKAYGVHHWGPKDFDIDNFVKGLAYRYGTCQSARAALKVVARTTAS